MSGLLEEDGEAAVNARGVDATSARRAEALLVFMRSWPRSWRRESIMEVISEELRRACPQNVQGPMPSFTQMILPQFRQLGAALRRGCRVARQVQARAEGEEAWREGLVWTSRARMAESWGSVSGGRMGREGGLCTRSWRVVEAPCMEAPPETSIFVFGAGDEVREG